MYCKEEQQISIDTTYEQQQLLWELGNEAFGWMQDAVGLPDCDTLDEAIEELAHDCGDTYEVVARLHLKNQTIIELHNHCFENVTNLYNKEYCGDRILVYDKSGFSYATKYKSWNKDRPTLQPLVRLEYNDEQGNFHQSQLPISQVCYADIFSVELDWKKLWRELTHEERERRRELWLKYWEECNERMKEK